MADEKKKGPAGRAAELHQEAKKKAEEAERQAKFKKAQARMEEFNARTQAEAAKREEARAAEELKNVYVVQSGDSLSKIAKEELGDASRWPEIFELNKDQIKDPNLIRVGQELRLPK